MKYISQHFPTSSSLSSSLGSYESIEFDGWKLTRAEGGGRVSCNRNKLLFYFVNNTAKVEVTSSLILQR